MSYETMHGQFSNYLSSFMFAILPLMFCAPVTLAFNQYLALAILW